MLHLPYQTENYATMFILVTFLVFDRYITTKNSSFLYVLTELTAITPCAKTTKNKRSETKVYVFKWPHNVIFPKRAPSNGKNF